MDLLFRKFRKSLGILVIWISVWIITWVIIGFFDSERNVGLRAFSFLPKLDTAELVELRIEGAEHTVRLHRQADQIWKINDRHLMSNRLRDLLFQIFLRAEGIYHLDSLSYPVEELSSFRVGLYHRDESVQLVEVIGHGFSQQTYLYDSLHKKYVLWEIPGYPRYLAGMFELSASQWRDRRLLESTWFSLKSISIHYPRRPEDDFFLVLDKYRPYVRGLDLVDSLFCRDYIDQFNNFLVNEYILSGQVDRYDSLLKTPPLAILRIEDIYPSASKHIELRYIPGDQYYLLRTKEGDLALSEFKRWKTFLITRSHFEPKS
ncbi:MAG: hypothetical protein OXB93_05800 [Cytophagales bacterium]|nr:hypothetical protein [Cytophagales bacterium]